MPENYSEQTNTPEDSISGHFVKLKTSQKVAFVVLAFFAVFVFGAWVVQLKNSIVSPLARPAAVATDNSNNASICTGPNCTDGTIEELKAKDTDKDGLNDYEELEIYKTSPYLEDSDSDGFSDYEEVQSDNDPNCPDGANCGSVPVPNSSKELIETDLSLPEQNLGVDPSIFAKDSVVLENILLGQSDVESLRALLLQSGMDENLLGQINDKDLMKYYEDTLSSMNEASVK
ncbi:MAG: hypothetical protein U9Q85_02980 [Patescibacteria group bacterium]|nr:hypothetical protein [Patescibacteria group bacterium]